MKKNKLKYRCYKCEERFKSWQERDRHYELEHQPPKETTEEMISYNNYHVLQDGNNLCLGDKIERKEIGIITKITKTEGHRNVDVELALIKKSGHY